MKMYINLLLCCLMPVVLMAQKPNHNQKPYPYGNPVITHMYTADAAPHVMPDGRVWMVTSVDHEDGGGYSTMHKYHTFSSADLVNWTDHGEVLNVADLYGPEGEPEGEDWALWAPDMIHHKGKYYLYFPVRILHTDTVRPNGGRVVTSYIAVAESDALDKKFTVINNRIQGTQGIDPSVFIDDDGQPYLYYGSHWGAKLKDNMIELDGAPVKMSVDDDEFMEAIWMNKRNGKYDVSYHRHYGKPIDPEKPDDPERGKSRLDYGRSTSPLGPFTYQGILNYELGVNVTPGPTYPGKNFVPWRVYQSNHGGIVEYHGQEYLFYHTSALSSWRQDAFDGPGTWTQRSVCVDSIKYRPDGTILPVQQTLSGVDPVVVNQPYEIQLPPVASKGEVVQSIRANTILHYPKLQLGSGYYYFDVQLSAPVSGNTRIEIRLDQPDGQLAGTIRLPEDLSFDNNLHAATFLRDARGTRDVYLRIVQGDDQHLQLAHARFFAGSPHSKADLLKAVRTHDRAIHPMNDWMRDPYITIGPDGDYYLTCTQQINETNSQGAPVWKSSDLVNWEHTGFPYQLKDASNYNMYLEKLAERNKKNEKTQPLRLWAPELHFINGRWAITHTSNAGLGNLAFTENETLDNFTTDWGATFGRQHDPSLFTDDDGTTYLVSRCASIQPLKEDLSGFAGPPVSIGPSNRKMGHEGAYIVKFQDKYILFGTAWSTDTMRHGTYNLYYCTADEVTGPYGPRQFAGRFLGHGTPFQDKQSRWWCTAFYNANEPTLSGAEASRQNLSETAYTINQQGLTLVPMHIEIVDGKVVIYPKDKRYQTPGPEEVQDFK